MRAIVLFLSLLMPSVAVGQDARQEGSHYSAGARADRIVLMPGHDPARSMAVAYRTSVGQPAAVAEIAVGLDGPGLEQVARRVEGVSASITTGNGVAVYHQVRFPDLEPATGKCCRMVQTFNVAMKL